jgi:hypothetical protein
MKHFKIIGPETTREFDIDDDYMVEWKIIKIEDYEKGLVQNEIIYTNEEETE